MTPANRYTHRVAHRLCVACAAGLQATDGVRCVECSAAQADDPGKAARAARHAATEGRKTYRATWMAARYADAAAAKACADCGAPVSRFRRCAKCRARRNAYNAAYRGRAA